VNAAGRRLENHAVLSALSTAPTDSTAGAQAGAELSLPHLEGAGGDELVVVEVRVDVEDLHGRVVCRAYWLPATRVA